MMNDDERRSTVDTHMTRRVVEVTSDIPLRDVIETMLKNKIHHLCVIEGGRLLGMISDRDIARALPSPLVGFGWRDYDSALDTITAGRVMTREPLAISPATEMKQAASLMLRHRIHALPVVETGRVVGVISEHDCLRHYVALLEAGDSDGSSSWPTDEPELRYLLERAPEGTLLS